MRTSIPLLRPRILVSGLFFAAIAASHAAVWTSTTSGGNWSATTNWQSGIIASGADAIADFSTIDITANTTVHLDASQTVGYLIFGDATPSTGANWTLDSNPAGRVLTLATTSGTTPTITVSNLGSSKLVTISANIAGTQGLTKAGTGTLILTGSNSYSGGTTVSAGTLQIGSSGTNPSLGMGDVQVQSGATVSFALGGTYTVDNNISGSGALIKATAGTMVLAGNVTISGTTTVQNSTLRMGGANVLSSNSVVSLGASGSPTVTLDLGNGASSYDQTVGGLTSVGTLANSVNYSITNSDSTAGHTATLTINQNADATFNGIIKDGASGASVAITKAGSKTLTLGAANTYSGATTITSGTLKAGAANTLSANSAVSLSAGATLDVSGGNNTIGSLAGAGGNVILGNSVLATGSDNKSTAFAGAISGSGSFVKTGTGEQTLSGINGYAGSTQVQGGKLTISGSLSSTGSVSVSQGAELSVAGLVNQSATISVDGVLSGAGLVGDVDIKATGDVKAGGDGIATLTTRAFTLASTSSVHFDLAAADTTLGGGVNDLIDVKGNLTLDGTLYIASQGVLTSGTYTLFTYTGNLTDNGLELSSAFLDTYAGSRIDSSKTGEIGLVVMVPEPSTWAMVVGGVATLMMIQNKRRRS